MRLPCAFESFVVGARDSFLRRGTYEIHAFKARAHAFSSCGIDSPRAFLVMRHGRDADSFASNSLGLRGFSMEIP
jgi:hypothetical protein